MQSSGVPFFLSGGSSGGGGGGSAFTWEGAWSSGITYAVDAVVEYNGSSYIAIQAGTNKQPDTEIAYWELMAEKGDTGAGVATGGTTGQYLKKASATNYDTAWSTISGGDIGTGTVADARLSANVSLLDTSQTFTANKIFSSSSLTFSSPTSGLAFCGKLTTDTYCRIKINTNGDTYWGSGTAAEDVVLYRGGTNLLKTDSDFAAASFSGSLSASDLLSGTVPLARLSNITDAEISASANISWSKVSKTGSSLADLATRTTANLTDFPSQASNSGKYLKTDGTNLSWETVSGGMGSAFAAALLFGGF